MAKPRRGKNVKTNPNWRGTCPACARTGVKLLWVELDKDNKQRNVCKRCGK